jgi:hypothetical protein
VPRVEQHGWRVLVLPRGISGRVSFFRGVKATCPLDPPLVRDDVWDALSDSLWNGLDALAESAIAVIWPESAVMAEVAADDFSIARDILANISESIADSNATQGQPKQIAVVLAGLIEEDQAAEPGCSLSVPFRAEHLLGVVVNWPSVRLTGDFCAPCWSVR